MNPRAWAYYSSAADDEITNRENHIAYHRWVQVAHTLTGIMTSCRIWFRPKILIDVTNVDFSTHILGHRSTMPIYIVSATLTSVRHFHILRKDGDSIRQTWSSRWRTKPYTSSSKTRHNTNGEIATIRSTSAQIVKDTDIGLMLIWWNS